MLVRELRFTKAFSNGGDGGVPCIEAMCSGSADSGPCRGSESQLLFLQDGQDYDETSLTSSNGQLVLDGGAVRPN